MGLILKENETYFNKFSAKEITTAYGFIHQINANRGDFKGHIVISVYDSKEAKDSGAPPIGSFSEPISKEQYDVIFDREKLDQEGMNPARSCYEYILQLIDDDDNLIYSKWMSDE